MFISSTMIIGAATTGILGMGVKAYQDLRQKKSIYRSVITGRSGIFYVINKALYIVKKWIKITFYQLNLLQIMRKR